MSEKEQSGQTEGSDDSSAPKQEKVGFFTVFASVFAAFFGVQKEENRQRDFQSGKFWHFFVAGLVFVLLFLLGVWGAVQYMLETTPTG